MIIADDKAPIHLLLDENLEAQKKQVESNMINRTYFTSKNNTLWIFQYHQCKLWILKYQNKFYLIHLAR